MQLAVARARARADRGEDDRDHGRDQTRAAAPRDGEEGRLRETELAAVGRLESVLLNGAHEAVLDARGVESDAVGGMRGARASRR